MHIAEWSACPRPVTRRIQTRFAAHFRRSSALRCARACCLLAYTNPPPASPLPRGADTRPLGLQVIKPTRADFVTYPLKIIGKLSLFIYITLPSIVEQMNIRILKLKLHTTIPIQKRFSVFLILHTIFATSGYTIALAYRLVYLQCNGGGELRMMSSTDKKKHNR